MVALVGRPNVGKSTFFARATGRFAESSNLPGTTVGATRRPIEVDGRPAVLVDLPGTLTLADEAAGLPPFWQLLLNERPSALLVVVDAGNLRRHLPLALAARDLGLPIVVAANLADEARANGVEIDVGRLSQLLAAPVHRTVGRTGEGVSSAMTAAVRLATGRADGRHPGVLGHAPPYSATAVRAVEAVAGRTTRSLGAAAAAEATLPVLDASGISPIGSATLQLARLLEPERWAVADRWAAQVERRRAVSPGWASRLERSMTAPWPGLPLFVFVTLATLGATMAVGTIMAGLLADAWAATASPFLASVVRGMVPIPPLAAALLWALDSGLLAMLSVGIPYVLSFYVVLALLEDSGYLASAAVLTDRIFNALGLPGRAAIPVLAATGCNVPAVYATRVLESRRERLLASFLITLTPCSARSAVVIAALAPFAGPVAAFGAFAVVVLIAVTSGVAANAIVPGRQSPMVLELPPLRVPVARAVMTKAWFRFRAFVVTAAPIMLVGSFVLGGLYETGVIGPLQAGLAPVTTGLLGLPPVAGMALVLAFLRKELALQLLLVLAVAQYGAAGASLDSFLSPGQLFGYAGVTAVSVPCIATVAALVDEFGRRDAVLMTLATLGVALGSGAILARIVGIA